MCDGVRKYISRDCCTSLSKKTRSQGTFTLSKMTTASDSSKREENGLSNSVTACFSKDFLTQRFTPSVPVGTAHVTACPFCSGGSGSRLPIQISYAIGERVLMSLLH